MGTGADTAGQIFGLHTKQADGAPRSLLADRKAGLMQQGKAMLVQGEDQN